MTRANEDTEEEVLGLKTQIDQLKKSAQTSTSTNITSEETKKLQSELRDKNEKVDKAIRMH